jgi:hypothetical protein
MGLDGQLLNGARDILWHTSILNRDITSSGKKGVEGERGEWPVFKLVTLMLLLLATHSVHNTPTFAQDGVPTQLSILYDIYVNTTFIKMI